MIWWILKGRTGYLDSDLHIGGRHVSHEDKLTITFNRLSDGGFPPVDASCNDKAPPEYYRLLWPIIHAKVL
jgi:hypothetical protein